MAAMDLNSGAIAPSLTKSILSISRYRRDSAGSQRRTSTQWSQPLRGRFKGNDVLDWWLKTRCCMASRFRTAAQGATGTLGSHPAMGTRARSGCRTALLDTNRTLMCSITPAKCALSEGVPRLLLRLNSKRSEQPVVTWDWQTV